MALEDTLKIEEGEYEIYDSLTPELVEILSSVVNDSTENKKALIEDYESFVTPKYVVLVKKYGKVAGIAVVEQVTETLDYVDKLFVAKEFQSNGVGMHMMDVLKQYSPSFGLRADKNNEKAINFYQRNGLDHIDDFENFGIYGFKANEEQKELLIDFASKKEKTVYKNGSSIRYEVDSIKNPDLLQKFLSDINFPEPQKDYALQN